MLAAGLFFFSLTAVKTLAGGQLIDLLADSNGWVSDGGYGRNMKVFISSGPQGFPCKGTEITFKFVDPKDGDYINTGSGTPTFVMQDDPQPFYKNGVRVGSICGTYAKMSSKVSGERTVTVFVKNGDRVWPVSDSPVIKVAFDGKYHSDNAYNNQNYRSSFEGYGWYQDDTTIQPTNTPVPQLPAGKPDLWLLNQQLVAPYGRQVTIKFGWPVTEGNVRYNIFTRKAKKQAWEKQLTGEWGPSAQLNIRADEDYYVKVQGCLNKIGTCVDSSELFVPKLKEQEKKKEIERVISKPDSVANPVSSDTAQLQQKVDNLQKKLEVSQQKQSELESRLNQMIAWIKSIFPFFK